MNSKSITHKTIYLKTHYTVLKYYQVFLDALKLEKSSKVSCSEVSLLVDVLATIESFQQAFDDPQ
jgi:hypothetical protein